MKNLLTIILISIACSEIYAQGFNAAAARNMNYLLRSQIPLVEKKDGKTITTVKLNRQPIATNGSNAIREITFLGSPYLIDAYKPATFTIDSSKTSITAPALLNLTTDELITKLNGKILIIQKIGFTLENREFIWFDGRYFEQLYGGKVKLLKRHVREIPPSITDNLGSTSGYGSNDYTDGEISSKEVYYLGFHTSDLREIKITPKSVISALTKENKTHMVNGDFERSNENDALIKAFDKVSKMDEKELIKIMQQVEQTANP